MFFGHADSLRMSLLCVITVDVLLSRVASRCRRRLMLTGTPDQNNLEELQSLLQFLLPTVFRADVIAAQLADEQACTAAHSR